MIPEKYLLFVAALLISSVIGLLVYPYVWSGVDAVRLPVVENCKLNLSACSTSLPTGGRIVFEINPRQPPAGETLYLSAVFEGVNPDAVGVRFKGINMNMGQLDYLVHELARTDIADGPVSFEGQGGVFVCSFGLMQWLVIVNLQVGETVYEVPFNFETSYDAS